jgi:hypothetical protein
MRKHTANAKKKTAKHLAVFLLAFGIFFSWGSSTATVRDFSLASGPILIGLPKWDGRDFSIIPDKGSIEIPLRELPTKPIKGETFPLPRDLDRDFGNQDHGTRFYRSIDHYSNACRYFDDSYTNRFGNCFYVNDFYANGEW